MMKYFTKGRDDMQLADQSVIELNNREILKLTGVQHIDIFETERIVLLTEQGILEVQGVQLNITQLDLDAGVLQITGNIDALFYPQERHKQKHKKQSQQSFIQKMLS